ncbi:MAG: methylenetetrahydrofolate--tRNA-(uracil(54)-C(5))-methyltransferase (FADH(2)-oxidizing) TrmFO [Clostridia bacterium]|nr:methylenetetrahydrofolate--tRNA-(uracil(54)-C(5))-methyltransferase (FADH(2)-oxidizing) TrmFO [Clostridia bacterium]
MNNKITVIGAGLAGCEAAWQAARLGADVTLYEMKPKKKTPAHKSDLFAELVCSNSLRSAVLSNAVGLLKEELRRASSLIMEAADASEVPAGSALAVDRNKFSQYITDKIKNNPRITVIEEEVTEIDENSVTVVATGPLTSEGMAGYLKEYLDEKEFYFFDAAAPIVDASGINFERAFYASRWGKGEASYINCPMEKEEYDAFYNELINAKEAEIHDFDREEQKDLTVFEGCMPVEVMAKRGHDTLLFGPMKPVGLWDPRYPDKEFYAVVQLRQETLDKTMYNIVGFQTHLTFGEQKRVFSMIPGLENAEFLRYGVMHRNTYINSPKLLDSTYALKKAPNVFFAGQMTGVEGYVESTASGLVAGINAAMRVLGKEKVDFPDTTATGALAHYISDENITKFQPMNVNFGIIRPLEKRVKGGKAAKNEALANRALEELNPILLKLKEEE